MPLGAWRKLVAAPVAELLKRRGFRKSGMNFSAPRTGTTLLVSLQSSRDSRQGLLKVTCNLGIRVDRLATRAPASVWEAHWRQRIGFFLPDPRDYWWVCTSDDQARRAGQEIAELLEANALQAMEQFATPTALAALWSSGQSPGLTDRERVEYLSQLVGSQAESSQS